MKVRLLKPEQKELIENELFDGEQFFNPILDADGNWIISNEEVNQCTCIEFEFVHDLPEIEFKPVINEDLI
jgi:hypothetical protein